MRPKNRATILVLLAIGFLTGLLGMLALTTMLLLNADRMRSINQQLYVHPFRVSNAAASLKSHLYEIRSQALVIVLMRLRGAEWAKAVKDIDLREAEARSELEIIKTSFLGDMNQVHTLEQTLDEWHIIRSHLLSEAGQGHHDLALQLIRTAGTPKFQALIAHSEYVHSFANRRAQLFVEEGEAEARTVLHQGILLSSWVVLTFTLLAVGVIWRIRFLHRVLDRLISTDELTGVPNRREFLSLLKAEAQRSNRYQGTYAVVAIDLDHFKQINDQWGHAVGDLVLRDFCLAAAQSMRKTDTLGRLGGEEFAILLPSTPLEVAIGAAQRIRASIESRTLEAPDGIVRYTASFGVAASTTGQSMEQVLASADRALYEAKHNGRNHVVPTIS